MGYAAHANDMNAPWNSQAISSFFLITRITTTSTPRTPTLQHPSDPKGYCIWAVSGLHCMANQQLP